MSDKLEFRPVRPEDCDGIARLFSRLWSWEYPKDYWRQKFFDNPAGPPMSHLALTADGGEIVGCMGGVPLRYRLNGTEGIGTLIVDVGVLPEYRKQRRTYWGVYKPTEADQYNRQTALVQAVATPAAEIIALKMMHFDPPCHAPVYKRRITVRAMIPRRLREKLRPASKAGPTGKWMAAKYLRKAQSLCERHQFTIAESSELDDRFDRLWSQADDQWPISLIRDSAFLKWRFHDHPTRKYIVWIALRGGDLAGYCVTDTLRRDGVARGRISDLLVLPDAPEVAEALLYHAMSYLCGGGADIIVGWFLPRRYWEPLLTKIGLRYRGDDRQIILRLFTAESIRPVIFDPENWYYTGADTDQI